MLCEHLEGWDREGGRETQRPNVRTPRGEGRSGMNWEFGIDIHTLLCIKQITNENLPYCTGNSTQCSVVT